jgi:hypothetical protein
MSTLSTTKERNRCASEALARRDRRRIRIAAAELIEIVDEQARGVRVLRMGRRERHVVWIRVLAAVGCLQADSEFGDGVRLLGKLCRSSQRNK